MNAKPVRSDATSRHEDYTSSLGSTEAPCGASLPLSGGDRKGDKMGLRNTHKNRQFAMVATALMASLPDGVYFGFDEFGFGFDGPYISIHAYTSDQREAIRNYIDAGWIERVDDMSCEENGTKVWYDLQGKYCGFDIWVSGCPDPFPTVEELCEQEDAEVCAEINANTCVTEDEERLRFEREEQSQ